MHLIPIVHAGGNARLSSLVRMQKQLTLDRGLGSTGRVFILRQNARCNLSLNHGLLSFVYVSDTNERSLGDLRAWVNPKWSDDGWRKPPSMSTITIKHTVENKIISMSIIMKDGCQIT